MARVPKTQVSFSWLGPAGQTVDLVGDFPDWSYPIRMNELGAGHYHCRLELVPGLYRYKFRLNGRIWVRDPLARAIDRTGPYDNGILVVGGAQPPLLFAPDRRHVAHYEDGRLVVQAELLGELTEPVLLWIRQGEERRLLVPLKLLGARGNSKLLRAETTVGPPSGRRELQFGFTSASEQAFTLPPPRPEAGRPPGWLSRAVFYSIFIDRWHRGRTSRPLPHARSRRAPSTAQTFYGGDLDGIREGLDYLADLGANALILTPVHPAPSPHRYDPTDLLSIDPALGGARALKRLLDAAHARGMRVVVDAATTHLNEANPTFWDLLRKQQRSRYSDWYRVRGFPVVPGDASTYAHYPGHPEQPWLELRSPGARRYVFKGLEGLVELGVDGLRLDTMHEAPPEFWAELRAKLRSKNPDLLLLGQVVGDNIAHLAEQAGLDAVGDYRHREAMLAFFGRGSIGAEEFWERSRFAELRIGPFEPSFRVLSLDNHDTARFLSAAVLYDRLRIALAYLMIRPEPVCVTYGTEYGLATGDPDHLLDDAWPERLPMPPLDSAPNQTQLLIKRLTALRRELEPQLGQGMRLVRAERRLLVLERPGPRATLRAYFNAGEETVRMDGVPPSAELLVRVNDPAATPSSPLPGSSARLLLLQQR